MRILLLSATRLEVEPILAKLDQKEDLAIEYSGHKIDVCIGGVGMLAMAHALTVQLLQNDYDLVLNVGICGAFDPSLELTEVVVIKSDLAAEEGAEDGNQWLTLYEMGLRERDQDPFSNGRLEISIPSNWNDLLPYRAVDAISVNRVLGNETSIEKMQQNFDVAVESMEGAAVYYCTKMQGVSCLQLRSVSNYVENRDRAAWKIKEALEELANASIQFLKNVEAKN